MPGKLGKLGGYSQRGSARDFEHWLAAGYGWAVALNHDADFWQPIQQRWGTKIIVRSYFGTQHLDPAWAQEYADAICRDADRLRSNGVTVTAVMGVNEAGLTSVEEVTRLASLELAMLPIIRGRGYQYACGSQAVTWPKLDHLPAYRDVLGASDFWKRHEYDAPSMRSNVGRPGYDDRVLYYRTLYAEAKRLGIRVPPIIIGECGIDGGVMDGRLRGFRAFPAVDYFDDLRWYAGELAKDAYVVAGIVYGVGMNADWESFDVVGTSVAARLEAATFAVQETPVTGAQIRVLTPNWTIQTMAVEEYLRAVVPNEMPALWPAAALQAQAVAARTYAMWRIANPRTATYDVYSDARDQVYSPGNTHAATDAAIMATAGLRWPVGTGTYVSRCGRVDCRFCNGANGYNGQTWPGRLCQYGAKYMAERGSTYREILAHYYGNGQEDPVAEYPPIACYDWQGAATTLAALQAKYKVVVRRAEERGPVAAGHEVFRVTALREKAGTTAVIARCLRADGDADAGRAVAGHWDGAPARDVPGQWETNYEVGTTNALGEVAAITMGSGGVIGPDGGPHAVWVVSPSTLSDCVDRIGWDGGTDHWHVDPQFTLTVQAAQPTTPPAPEPGTPTEALRNAGWNAAGVAYNPDAALTRYAQAHGLGAALGNETYVVSGYVVQPFRDAILYVAVGDWDNIHELTW